MSLSTLIEKLGKTIFETPFDAALSPADAPELAEIRLAVLEQIRLKGRRSAGRMVFPFNVVRIHVRGVTGEEADLLKSEFLKGYFEREIRTGLAKSHFQFPADLEVEFATSADAPRKRKDWIVVEAVARAKQSADSAPQPSAKLVVVRGTANTPVLALDKERINIGRTVEIYRAGGPSRRNDLAFTEESEINRSVSREHAHILYSKKTGEYRIYNDRWNKHDSKPSSSCGLWIIREGLSREVHHDARGVRLQPGDEIQLGRALVRFERE